MITNILYEGNYKKYLILPLLLLIIFLGAIFVYPGVRRGIDLTGGTSIIVRSDSPLDPILIIPKLKEKYPLTELSVNSVSSVGGYGIVIQYGSNTDLSRAKDLLANAKSSLASNPENAKKLAIESVSFSSKYFTPAKDVSALAPQEAVVHAEETLAFAEQNFETEFQLLISQTFKLGENARFQKTQIGPSLGETFFGLAIQAFILGMVLLSIVIFLYFREFLTSVTVIGGSIFNIIGAVALMSIFSIPISLTTIPALLMLIGYAVDTEIVMSARVLKRRENTPKERLKDSIGTVFTMNTTAVAAVVAMVVLSYFAQIGVIFEISAVLLFGLLCDFISSTTLNAPLILMHAEKEAAK